MNTLELPFPTARTNDPDTSHAAAKAVRPGAEDLHVAIRSVVRAHSPITAFEIAERVNEFHPGRWDEGTIRTAVARCDLVKLAGTARSPRGRTCALYATSDRTRSLGTL